MVIRIKKSILRDVEDLSRNLRKEDEEEVKANNKTPYKALLGGLVLSDICYTAYDDEKPIGMFGVSSLNLPKKWGSIWFLGSEDTKNFPVSFVRLGKKYVKEFLKDYLILINAVYAKNTTHIKWLDCIGFTLTKSMFKNGKEFIQFYKTKES